MDNLERLLRQVSKGDTDSLREEIVYCEFYLRVLRWLMSFRGMHKELLIHGRSLVGIGKEFVAKSGLVSTYTTPSDTPSDANYLIRESTLKPSGMSSVTHQQT